MATFLKSFLSTYLCFLFSFSFSQQNPDTAKSNKDAEATFNNYITAVNKHDISKALSYWSNSQDFLVFDNGRAMNYDEFTTNLRTAFLQIKKTVVRYNNVHIRNIAENVVLITGLFRQNVTANNDSVFEFDVTASFILLKKDEQWKISYSTVVASPESK